MHPALSLLVALTGTTALAGEPIVDTFGGTRYSNTGSGSFKINVFRVTTSVRLVGFAPYLGSAPGNEVLYTVYVEDETTANQWHLLWASAPVALSGDTDFQGAPPLELPLFAGARYALGVYLLADSVTYAYDDTIGSETVTWGVREGALWTQNGTVSQVTDPIQQIPAALGYYQRVTVVLPEDLDGDGFDDLVDCDDGDAEVHPGAVEVCDGLDNDCNGRLLEEEQLDADLDGVGDCLDCAPGDPDVYPGADEPACSEVDLDCDGVAGDPDACGGEWTTGEERVTGARCSSVPVAPLDLGLLGGLLWLVRRRRAGGSAR